MKSKSEIYFGPLAAIGSPFLECKNTVGVYVDGHVVGAIYWIVTSAGQGYSLIIQKNNIGMFATEEAAKKAAWQYGLLHFTDAEVCA